MSHSGADQAPAEGDDKMRTLSYGRHMLQLTRYPRVFPVSCYLVREDDGFTLIDTGLPNSARDIQAIAQAHGAPIVRIAITHAHMDHVGSLDELHAALPEAEVLVSERDARFLAGERSLDPDEPQDKLRGGYVTCATRPTRLLHGGDRVGSLEVIASPGHTPGHIAFFDRRDRSLIAGDAFMTQGGIAVSGQLRILFPISPFVTWHRPTAIASARAMRALEPALLAVGHGPVLESPLAAIDEAIRIAERHEAQAHTHA
jgi:glyoxylase-like metal-dependent hydrolase (beta-lactamase superfamily II)